MRLDSQESGIIFKDLTKYLYDNCFYGIHDNNHGRPTLHDFIQLVLKKYLFSNGITKEVCDFIENNTNLRIYIHYGEVRLCHKPEKMTYIFPYYLNISSIDMNALENMVWIKGITIYGGTK